MRGSAFTLHDDPPDGIYLSPALEMFMHDTVRKWGDSAAVRIPGAVLEAARLRLDQPVDVREEGGRVVIEPLTPHRYDIEALVAGITDENRHDPVDMGRPAGLEAW